MSRPWVLSLNAMKKSLELVNAEIVVAFLFLSKKLESYTRNPLESDAETSVNTPRLSKSLNYFVRKAENV